jgi:hypothetical protein
VAAGVVADATAGEDPDPEVRPVRSEAEARQEFPWAVAHQSVEARRSRGPAAVHLDRAPQPWRDHRSAERHRTFPDSCPDSCRRVQSEHWAPRSPERAGADCSGSLPTAGEDPDSLELEDDPESLGPDDDGSNSVDPDDDPESGDAAAYPPPVPSPSRVASTPQAMARPASKRLVFTVGFPTSVRRSRREDPGAEQHESDEGRREVG